MDKVRSEFEAWQAAYVGGDGSPFEYDPQEVEDAFAAGWQAALTSREGEAVAWMEVGGRGRLGEPLESRVHVGRDRPGMMPTAIPLYAAPSARVAELEAKLLLMVEAADNDSRRIAALESQLAASREREGRMREALEEFGMHSDFCQWLDNNVCDCGLDAALAAEKGEKE